MTPAPASEPGGAVATPRPVFTVSRLNSEARSLLERTYRGVWVEGEISNLSRPRSGHVYFTLKDDRAQVRCAMFRNRVPPRLALRDGMQVVVRGQVSLYENRGEFQIIVESLEETGEGALRRAFEALKARLQAEGLFDSALKRPIPALPARIGVITSPTGAAVRDVLNVLSRRFPAIPVRIYPIPVQGAGAAPRIVAALERASRRRDCDVLILTRGGGSLEDLWAFNDEVVARAIRRSVVPVVSAVGHEVDVTISDFAADVRAPTPSAAAELVVPDAAQWLRQLTSLEARLSDSAFRRLGRESERLTWLAGRLERQHPATRFRQGAQRTDELADRLQRSLHQRIAAASTRLAHLEARLATASPRRRLAEARRMLSSLHGSLAAHGRRALHTRRVRLENAERRLDAANPVRRLPALKSQQAVLADRLQRAMRRRLERATDRLSEAGHTLEAVSPLATLARGYAIVHRVPGTQAASPPRDAHRGELVRSYRQIHAGDVIRARLHDGHVTATVSRIEGAEE